MSLKVPSRSDDLSERYSFSSQKSIGQDSVFDKISFAESEKNCKKTKKYYERQAKQMQCLDKFYDKNRSKSFNEKYLDDLKTVFPEIVIKVNDEDFKEVDLNNNEHNGDVQEEKKIVEVTKKNKCSSITEAILNPSPESIAKLIFFVNLVLLATKILAGVLSHSLAIFSSVVDSVMDLFSGALLYLSERAMKKFDTRMYPKGRARLAPLSITVLAVVMMMASLQVVVSAMYAIMKYVHFDHHCLYKDDLDTNRTFKGTIAQLSEAIGPCLEGEKGPCIDNIILGIFIVTIGTKLIMCFYFRRFSHVTIKALAQDQRNDVLSNTAALIFGYLGDKVLKYFDAVGAILISLYIIITWCFTAREQMKVLSGHTASNEMLNAATYFIIHHHPQIRHVKKIHFFHETADEYLLEVDVQMSSDLSLKESGDIAQQLKVELEEIPEIKTATINCLC